MGDSDQKQDKYETISIESKIREGVFHKVVKDTESGKAVSCSCKCWSKGNKPGICRVRLQRRIHYEYCQTSKLTTRQYSLLL